MRAYEPDRVVRALSGLATGLYYLVLVLSMVGLLAIPAGKLIGSGRADAFFHIEAPVRVRAIPELAGPWRVQGAHVEVSTARATVIVPTSALSGGYLALVWVSLAVFAGLVLLFLHHLRRLFQRVREGAPFDRANAVRLRWLGIVLMAATLWRTATDIWLSLSISRMLEGPGHILGTGGDLHLPVILVALVLIALAEIFRRGAALEDEQALVV